MDDDNIILTPPGLRTCTKCGSKLPASSLFFYQRKEATSGLRTTCKRCDALRAKAYRARCADQIKAAKKLYYQEHRDRDCAKSKTYYRAHKTTSHAQSRRWIEEHPEDRKAITKRNRDAHKEERAAYNRAYDEAHRSAVTITKRKWREANIVKVRASKVANEAKRRAQKHGAAGAHYTADDVVAQRERQKHKCFYCGKPLGAKQHVDHVTPLSKGGSNGPENIVVTCPTCNMRKHNKHPMDFAGILL